MIKDCACKRARHNHGTYGAYTVDRCRCPECKEAARIYRKRTKFAAANGRSNRLPADRTIAHVRTLLDAGWSICQIGRESGVSSTTIVHMLSGGAYTMRRTERAIMALRPDQKRTVGYIDPTGTHRRVRALCALGWPMAWVAGRLGVEESSLRQTMSASAVQAPTAHAVTRLFDIMWDELPPTRTANQRRQVARARNTAARNGWAPPLAWDDIDDPQEVPQGIDDGTTHRDFLQIEELARAGYQAGEIARRLGIKKASLHRRCLRAERLDLWRHITRTEAA